MDTLCTVQKLMAKMSHIITSFHSILLLHCFPLCPLCGLAERRAIFWRSTQPNKLITHRQTARGATFERQGQPMNVCICVCVIACIHYVMCSCTSVLAHYNYEFLLSVTILSVTHFFNDPRAWNLG